MLDLDPLARQPTLTGELVRLEPVGVQHLDGLWPLYALDTAQIGSGEASDRMPGRTATGDLASEEPPDDPLDHSLAVFARDQVLAGLAKAADREDRADWAVVRLSDDLVLGEVVLFDLDEDACSMSFRIALTGHPVFGRGYGTEATTLVRDFAFDRLRLHRLSLHVDADNPAALAVYTKVGFVREGTRRDAVRRAEGWVDVYDMALLVSDPRP